MGTPQLCSAATTSRQKPQEGRMRSPMSMPPTTMKLRLGCSTSGSSARISSVARGDLGAGRSSASGVKATPRVALSVTATWWSHAASTDTTPPRCMSMRSRYQRHTAGHLPSSCMPNPDPNPEILMAANALCSVAAAAKSTLVGRWPPRYGAPCSSVSMALRMGVKLSWSALLDLRTASDACQRLLTSPGAASAPSFDASMASYARRRRSGRATTSSGSGQ